MAYKALYRTYRPQTFSEVAGQEAIVKTLQNALLSNKLSHAYLFSGPRGTGKTTMAKLFAKSLNCEQGMGHQCNGCENCVLLQQNAHPDIIEIDAASNNGVEEVRDLIDKVKYSPIKGRYKVYIIDEVHMMTSSAFNALLKTLEEPPAHVIFILATTEPHKIIPTILSRCQRYDFGKVSNAAILTRLQLVLTQEKITVHPAALEMIIQLSEGGMRDALSLLDQAIAYAGDSIVEKDILQLFGMISKSEKLNVIEAFANKQASRFIQLTDQFIQLGIDEKRLLNELIDVLKDLLILFKTKDPTLLTILNEDDVNRLLNVMTIEQTERLLDMLFYLLSDFKVNGHWLRMFQLRGLTLMEKVLDHPSPNHEPKPKPTPSLPKVSTSPIQPSTSRSALSEDGESLYIDDLNIIKIMVDGNKEAKQSLLKEWDQLDTLMLDDQLGPLATLLKDGKPYVLSEHVLILEYDNPLLASKLNRVANQVALQDLLSNLYPEPVLLYAVNRQESLKLNKLFLDLRQLGKLPVRVQTPPTVKNWKFPL
jgi:DNA polymerase-3 subunit gamma/tau